MATRPHHPNDDDLGGFAELIHSPLPGPIAAIYEAAGTTIDAIALIQNTWWPGRQLTVRYRISGSEGELSGDNDVVATIGRIPAGAAIVEGPDGPVGLWVVPDDPMLPGLRSTLDIPTVSRVLADLGSTDEVTRARLRSYRPGRRAVVEVRAGRSSIFLKVVPPAQVDELHEKHRFLSDFLPVPDSLGVAPDLGVVVMRALPGKDLRTALRAGTHPLPDAATLARMIEGLPQPPAGWTSKSPFETLPNLVALLGGLLPTERDRLDLLVGEIGSERGTERVPVHGDFHEAQILTRGEMPIGLIDVDTYGWGHSGDDAATMLAHLHLLAPSCANPAQTMSLARDLNLYWDTKVDPTDLRLRTAAVVLGLATGPFRVNRPNWVTETIERIVIAEQWVQSARRVDERSLIATSGRSHEGLAS
ncbi:MAG TPA: phosphotransferase [Acidimicrobiia bacterium]|nr:phosphotransferase [Acidimicrobiia bacterium]